MGMVYSVTGKSSNFAIDGFLNLCNIPGKIDFVSFSSYDDLLDFINSGKLGENVTYVLEGIDALIHPVDVLDFCLKLAKVFTSRVDANLMFLTNSPYIVRALEVAFCKEVVLDKINFFLEYIERSYDMEDIYIVLARPLQEIDNLRCAD